MSNARARRYALQSLRSRLLARVSVALFVIFAAAAGAVYFLVRASLLAEFDGALAAQASAIASLTEQDERRIKLEIEPGEIAEFSPGKRPQYFQLWEVRGGAAEPVIRSESLAGADLPPPPPRVTGARSFEFLRLPNGKQGRKVSLWFSPRLEDEAQRPAGQPRRAAVLVVARATHDLDDTLERLAGIMLGVWGVAILASMGVMDLVIGRGLRPLGSLAASIERVGADDLSERIHLDATPSELSPVVQRLNDLLGRLEAALAREKSFTADVAHELRTPLAGLETTLEVCASRIRQPAEYEATVGKCLAVARAMHAMVNDLLLMARAEAGQVTANRSPVDLSAFVQECWRPFASRALARSLRVAWEIPEGPANLDAEKMRIVLNNLFDNAVTYADDGGSVGIAVRRVGEGGTMTITNTGSRVSPAEATKLFDRFWRGDEARSATGVHCGLGLSLSRKITESLGGTLTADSRDGIFTATLTW